MTTFSVDIRTVQAPGGWCFSLVDHKGRPDHWRGPYPTAEAAEAAGKAFWEKAVKDQLQTGD